MAVRNLRSIRPKIWVPPSVTANYRLTVTRSDSTVDDITDILLAFKVTDGVTEGIGNFEFRIPNPNETYTSVWTGMEILNFYVDYASGTASTLRFRARLEKISRKENDVVCTGRTESLFVQDQTVTSSHVSEDAGSILKSLFDTYGQSRFNTASIDTSTGVSLTLNFVEKPFWSAVEDICTASGYDCYIDSSLVVQFIVQGSRVNTSEAIVHDSNLFETGDFAPDLQFIKNKIRVLRSYD